jgi:threonine dehydratase
MSACSTHGPVSIADITAARERIQHRIHHTPVVTSESLNALVGAWVLLKCENLQRAGVFKARGAINAVFSRTESEAHRGVVTSSSGKQAAALSLAACTWGTTARLGMPRAAVKAKISAVRCYGGNICGLSPKARCRRWRSTTPRWRGSRPRPIRPRCTRTTMHVRSPDKARVRSNFLEDCPELDFVLAPVGAGGLLAGTAVAVKALNAVVQLIRCEPAAADDPHRSFRTGHRVPFRETPRTIADELRTSLGELTFAIISKDVNDIVTVTEDSIVRAMRLGWEVLKLIIEPSSAVALATLIEKRLGVDGKRVGVIISGGNADLDHLPWAMQSPREP